MTQEEAQKIARIVGHADGGCSACVGDLVARLNEQGLGWRFTKSAETIYPDYDAAEPEDTRIVVTVTLA